MLLDERASTGSSYLSRTFSASLFFFPTPSWPPSRLFTRGGPDNPSHLVGCTASIACLRAGCSPDICDKDRGNTQLQERQLFR